jgi:hypothetical protein
MVTKIESVDASFYNSNPSDLGGYNTFFEHFRSQKPDTLYFLSEAVSDYKHSSIASSISILGVRVLTEDNCRKTTLQAWDLLFRGFSDCVSWRNFERFQRCFEVVVPVRKLDTFRSTSLYRVKTSSNL